MDIDNNFKFEIGETILIANTEGFLHGSRRRTIEKFIGANATVIQRGSNGDCENQYLLNIMSNGWWFHEFNLEDAEKGFDAEDIIKKAFDLGG